MSEAQYKCTSFAKTTPAVSMADTQSPAGTMTAPRTPDNLNIRTSEELQDFWRTILPEFLEVVDPENSGFLEELYAGELLTHTDYESLVSGKDYVPRKQKTRRLWFILSSYSVDVFATKVAPKLFSRFAPIIPERFLTAPEEKKSTAEHGSGEQCLCHSIQNRIRLETVADLLCHHACLSRDVYGDIINEHTRKQTEKWNQVLSAFSGQPSHVHTMLESKMVELLHRYNVPCPDNMADLLSRGLPCTCEHPEPNPPDAILDTSTHVQSWLERKVATLHQPSPDSSFTRVDMSTCSLSSSLRPASEVETYSMVSETGHCLDKQSVGSAGNSEGSCPPSKPAKGIDGSAAETEALLPKTRASNDAMSFDDMGATSSNHETAPGSESVTEKVNDVEEGHQHRSKYYTHFSNFFKSDGFFESVKLLFCFLGSCLSAIVEKARFPFNKVIENQYIYHTLRTFMLVSMVTLILSLFVMVCARAYGSPLNQLETVWVCILISVTICGYASVGLVVLTVFLFVLVTSSKLLLKPLLELLARTRICKRCYKHKREIHMA